MTLAHTMNVNGVQNNIGPIYFQCIGKKIFSVPQKKKRHAGLEWHEGEWMMTGFSFLSELLVVTPTKDYGSYYAI